VIAVVWILFVLWMIYTSAQTQVVESGSISIPDMDGNVTEESPHTDAGQYARNGSLIV
jgi:hypothetical protein